MNAFVRHGHARPFLLLAALAIVPLAREAAAGSYGACDVRDGTSNLPDYWDPDLAPGYAKLNQPTNDFPTLLQLCSDDVYETLMQVHCSCNPSPQAVQWLVASYNSQGFCAFLGEFDNCVHGCAASGCASHGCAGVPTISCPGEILHVVDAVRLLLASGTLNEGQANALISKLQSAIAALQNGHENAAQNKLNAFKNQVMAMVNAGTLSAAAGQALIDEADAILAGL
jgi:FIMAH domain-containing protein